MKTTALAASLIFLLMMVALLHNAMHNAQWLTPSTTVSDVSKLQELARECDKAPRGYSRISTTWSAPVGHARKPVAWTITCNTMEK